MRCLFFHPNQVLLDTRQPAQIANHTPLIHFLAQHVLDRRWVLLQIIGRSGMLDIAHQIEMTVPVIDHLQARILGADRCGKDSDRFRLLLAYVIRPDNNLRGRAQLIFWEWNDE